MRRPRDVGASSAGNGFRCHPDEPLSLAATKARQSSALRSFSICRTRLPFVTVAKCSIVCIYTSKMNSREIIAKLESDGWFKVAQKGSHVQFKHPTKPGRVTVPYPNRDIPLGTLRSIEKQAGLKLR